MMRDGVGRLAASAASRFDEEAVRASRQASSFFGVAWNGQLDLQLIFGGIQSLFDGIGIVLQDFVDDVDDALVLEDLVVARERRELP
jgi:hypothetical protein